MKNIRKLILLCIACVLAHPFISGQVPTIDQIKTTPVTVNTGITFKLHSKAMNEDRTIMIGVPDGYATSNKKYPVLYLLDGQWAFDPTVQALAWLSNPQYGMIPQTIVVSLHTGDNRMNVMAPTMDKQYKSGGGGDKLYEFIKEELIPFVDKNYRTYNYRVIGGASLGGLFVMYAFVNDPYLFNGYLSLSPAMWWDNNVILDRTKAFLLKNPNLHSRIYLALANEGPQMGVDSLASILEKCGSKDIVWKYDKQEKEVHETVGYKGTWDGMKFLLSDWQYPLIDFGTKDRLFSSQDSAAHTSDNHKIVKISDAFLGKYSDIYLDSYGRMITLSKVEKALVFSCDKHPALLVYPESENKFFMKMADVQKNLFLKGFDLELEFIKDDSLVITANGKVDFTAKRIKHPPFIKLSDNILEKYVGVYLPMGQKDSFDVTKEGNSLKISTQGIMANLRPIAENKFFLLFKEQRNSIYEIEFIKDASGKVIKMNISEDQKVVVEADKKN